MKKLWIVVPTLLAWMLGWPDAALASGGGATGTHLDLTSHTAGYLSILVFVVAYLFVMTEEFTHLRKSKPVLLSAGLIWAMIAYVYASHGLNYEAEVAVRHNILEYSELFLFLLVAMTYINAMEERQVFESMRAWLVRAGFGYRKLFWTTGLLAFFISPIADNLTTALLMCAVLLAVGRDNPKFVSIALINVVVSANAGGAFSPFGDITTLMVWQKGIVSFGTFFALFLPSVVNWIVPASIMHFAVPDEKPVPSTEVVAILRGGKRTIFLFLMTIVTAVSFHNFLHMPPTVGMMLGLSYLMFLGFYLKKTYAKTEGKSGARLIKYEHEKKVGGGGFDLFYRLARAEWDTLMFFYGVILSVGGLGFLGYLGLVSETMYVGWGPTAANATVGVLSAIVDNIPVMFAVLTMQPDMSMGQWLLVTLTAGVGGSMLSVGSAAGVALMGQARGIYTFFSHLKWAPAIALGYAASIWVHFLVNDAYFQLPPNIR